MISGEILQYNLIPILFKYDMLNEYKIEILEKRIKNLIKLRESFYDDDNDLKNINIKIKKSLMASCSHEINNLRICANICICNKYNMIIKNITIDSIKDQTKYCFNIHKNDIIQFKDKISNKTDLEILRLYFIELHNKLAHFNHIKWLINTYIYKK